MSDDPVLTSSWCTNWAGFNTPRLWAMVSDEDDPDAWRQVAAWGDVAVTVKDQRARLVQARDSLTAAWPPGQNESSQAFVSQLNKLITVMDSAQQDADTTASGLANILEALRTAKEQIQPLYEEYKQKSDDWVPSWWDNAEDEIDQKAQAAMITAEQVVQQNVPQLKVPDSYVMDPKGAQTGLTPDDHSAPSTSSRSAGPGTAPTIPVPHDPVPPMPGQDATVPDAGSSAPDASFVGQTGPATVGPGLAGVITPPPPGVPPAGAVPPGALPPGGVPAGGGPLGIPPVVPPLPGVLPGGAGVGGGAVPGVGGIGGGLARGLRPVGGVAGRALPSGAVIGETVGGVRGGVAGTPEIGGVAGRGAVGGVPGRGAGGVSGRGVAGGRGGVAGGTVGEIGPGGVSGRGGVAGRGVGEAGRGGVPGRGGVAGRGVGVGEEARGGVPGRTLGEAGTGGMAGGRGGAPARGPAGRGVGGAAERNAGQAVRRGAKPKPPPWLPEDEPRGSAIGRGGAAGPAGMAGGRRAARRDGAMGDHYDPDNPWEVAEGVDPVIAPSDEVPRHDPGPNVIGWRG